MVTAITAGRLCKNNAFELILIVLVMGYMGHYVWENQLLLIAVIFGYWSSLPISGQLTLLAG